MGGLKTKILIRSCDLRARCTTSGGFKSVQQVVGVLGDGEGGLEVLL